MKIKTYEDALIKIKALVVDGMTNGISDFDTLVEIGTITSKALSNRERII